MREEAARWREGGRAWPPTRTKVREGSRREESSLLLLLLLRGGGLAAAAAAAAAAAVAFCVPISPASMVGTTTRVLTCSCLIA
jgi:hypothetical protein